MVLGQRKPKLEVLRYKVGERYKVHHDGMNRFLTMFLVLSDGFDGGWTYSEPKFLKRFQQESNTCKRIYSFCIQVCCIVGC